MLDIKIKRKFIYKEKEFQKKVDYSKIDKSYERYADIIKVLKYFEDRMLDYPNVPFYVNRVLTGPTITKWAVLNTGCEDALGIAFDIGSCNIDEGLINSAYNLFKFECYQVDYYDIYIRAFGAHGDQRIVYNSLNKPKHADKLLGTVDDLYIMDLEDGYAI